MGRALRRALRLLACLLAAASLLGAWATVGRLAAVGPAVARSYDRAESVQAEATRLQAALARAAAAAGVTPADPIAEDPGPPATAGEAPGRAATGGAADGTGPELAAYWHAQGDATRALDGLQELGRELEWLGAEAGGVRAATVSEMAALDEAMRVRRHRPGATPAQFPAAVSPAATAPGAALPEAALAVSSLAVPGLAGNAASRLAQVAGRVQALGGLARDHRRAEVADALARAVAEGRSLLAFVLAGVLAAPALLLSARRQQMRPSWSRRILAVLGSQAGQVIAPDLWLDRGWDGSVPDRPVMDGPASRVSAAPTTQRSPGLRVLLVEDNAMVRLSTAAMLSDLGHTVSAAGDAAQAIRMAEGGLDVLVTDLGLPDLDGVALAERLRAQQPGLRIVVASGSPGEHPGMIWLQKPFDLTRLERAVEATAASQ